MRLKKPTKFAIVLLLAFGLVGFGEKIFMNNADRVDAQTLRENQKPEPQPTATVSDELRKARVIGSGLDEALEKSVETDGKSDWKLSRGVKNPYGSSIQTWELQGRKVNAYIKKYETVEEAKEFFDKNKDPGARSYGSSVKIGNDFGEESYLVERDNVTLGFRSKNYIVILTGNDQDVKQIAVKIQLAINKKVE